MNGNLILQRLKGPPKQRQFAVFDLETRTDPITKVMRAFAACFYDGKEFTDFHDYSYEGKCADELIRHMFSPKYAGYWIYAHNGGNFDFTFLLQRLITVKSHAEYVYDWVPSGSSIIAYTVMIPQLGKHNKKCRGDCKGCVPKRGGADNKYMQWTLVDSVRLMKMSLKKMGETFKVTPKREHGLSWEELTLEKNKDIMQPYNRGDCQTLFEALGEIQARINKLGAQMERTLPATAMDLFRRQYQKHDIHINRHFKACPQYELKPEKGSGCTGCSHEFQRQAYFGGRTEIFRMVFKPYRNEKKELVKHAHMYDVNSHYASCMRRPMPVGPAIELEGLTEAEVWENSKSELDRVGIVECEVEIPEDCYLPPLPVYDKKLFFPTGRLRGVWSTVELRLLPLVGGRILRTFKSLWFETRQLFGPYVGRLYEYRDKSKASWEQGMDTVAKDLMTNLYGKFAMRENRKRYLNRPQSPVGLIPLSMALDVWMEDTFVSPRYIIPQLSIHITAIARAELWKLARWALDHGGRIYYCDTDSLVVAGVEMPTGSKLGELKLERTFTYSQFDLPKMYKAKMTEHDSKKKKESNLKIKAKGCGPGFGGGYNDYDGQLPEEEYDNLTQRGIGITRERITKTVEAMNDYIKNQLDFPRLIMAPKTMRSKYDKRDVLDDYDTKPIKLTMF